MAWEEPKQLGPEEIRTVELELGRYKDGRNKKKILKLIKGFLKNKRTIKVTTLPGTRIVIENIGGNLNEPI